MAVASVIQNRASSQKYIRMERGDALRVVCLEPYQFSCWRPDRSGEPAVTSRPGADDPQFAVAMQLSVSMVAGTFVPVTSATHYHANYVHPAWADKLTVVTRIGRHVFYE